MKRTGLKASRLSSESKKRLDRLGISYKIEGLPEVYVHGETYYLRNRGTCRTYCANVDKREIARASTLNTLLWRIEQYGMSGFLKLVGGRHVL